MTKQQLYVECSYIMADILEKLLKDQQTTRLSAHLADQIEDMLKRRLDIRL